MNANHLMKIHAMTGEKMLEGVVLERNRRSYSVNTRIKHSKESKAAAVQMRKEGHLYKEICEKYDIPFSTLNYWVRLDKERLEDDNIVSLRNALQQMQEQDL